MLTCEGSSRSVLLSLPASILVCGGAQSASLQVLLEKCIINRNRVCFLTACREAPTLGCCCYCVSSVDSIVILLPHWHAQFFCVTYSALHVFSHDIYMYTLKVGMQICFGSLLKASKHGTVICFGVCACAR